MKYEVVFKSGKIKNVVSKDVNKIKNYITESFDSIESVKKLNEEVALIDEPMYGIGDESNHKFAEIYYDVKNLLKPYFSSKEDDENITYFRELPVEILTKIINIVNEVASGILEDTCGEFGPTLLDLYNFGRQVKRGSNQYVKVTFSGYLIGIARGDTRITLENITIKGNGVGRNKHIREKFDQITEYANDVDIKSSVLRAFWD